MVLTVLTIASVACIGLFEAEKCGLQIVVCTFIVQGALLYFPNIVHGS